MRSSVILLALGTFALGAGVGPGPALAQSAAPTPAETPQSRPTDELLGEVVVTATQQASTVNKVPLSISVISQKTIDVQGIKTVEELSRTVPGVTFRRTGQEQDPNITIRGIGGNGATVGSQTTGVYLDDTPLQRRNLNGLITGNGAPFPLLFDLDRVEVLRGPQGTLYGASSEGGTIRFITPTPSLESWYGKVRTEVSGTEGGGVNYEAGAAVGGPIVQDQLGFRLSGIYRKASGYIDALSKYDGHRFADDVNWSDASAVRLAFAWQMTPRARLTPAFYLSHEYSNADDTFWSATPATSWTGGPVRNGGSSNAAGPVCTMSQAAFTAPCRTTGGVYFAFPDTAIAPYSNGATPWYGERYKTGNGRYLSTTDVSFVPSPRRTDLFVPTLTFDYDFDSFSLKSITSYVHDRTYGARFTGGVGNTRAVPRILSGPQPCSIFNNPLGTNTTCYLAPDYLPGNPDIFSLYHYANERSEVSEELRFASPSTATPLSWVAGLYFSDSGIHMRAMEYNNEDGVSLAIRGVPEAWFSGNYGLPPERNPALAVGDINSWAITGADRETHLDETEISVFGEAHYAVTSKLTLTAGLRLTHYEQKFDQSYGGAVAGIPLAGASDANPAGFVPNIPGNGPTNPVTDPNDLRPFALNLAGCPTASDCPLQYTSLKLSENPVSPKVAVTYQFSPEIMLYGTISRGFRPGGVNPPVPPIPCATDLAALGISAAPRTFKADTVTSYEAGAKMRLLGDRVQLNTAVFWIDWNDVQFNFNLACGFAFLSNAAKATSKGAELQAAGRFGPFTLSANIGYDQAVFAQDVRESSSGALLQLKGDNLGVPDWTVALGAQYDFHVANRYDAFVRADYTYTGGYARTPGRPVSTYDPLIAEGDATNILNARVGVAIERFDVSLFAQNLTNSGEYINKSHLPDSTRITGTTFRPRTIGLQVNYRY